MVDEWGKRAGYYKMSSYINNGNWIEISKYLENILSFFGRRNWDFLNTHKEFYDFFDLEKKYEEEEKREIDKVEGYYNNQPGYIYPCFIKATVIEEEEGERAGLGLGRLPNDNTHCKIIRFADTGSVLADEYIVTDPKRIKIATGENTTFNPKSMNIYEMITSFDVFEKKSSNEICNNVLCFNKKLKKMGFISVDELYKIRVLIKGDGDELERTFDIEVPDISISRRDFETSKEYRDELEYYKNEVSVEGWNFYGKETEWREIFFYQIEDILDDLNLKNESVLEKKGESITGQEMYDKLKKRFPGINIDEPEGEYLESLKIIGIYKGYDGKGGYIYKWHDEMEDEEFIKSLMKYINKLGWYSRTSMVRMKNQHFMNISPKLSQNKMTIPDILYHACPMSRLNNILKNGLKSKSEDLRHKENLYVNK